VTVRWGQRWRWLGVEGVGRACRRRWSGGETPAAAAADRREGGNHGLGWLSQRFIFSTY
jgi:hypothetical protein